MCVTRCVCVSVFFSYGSGSKFFSRPTGKIRSNSICIPENFYSSLNFNGVKRCQENIFQPAVLIIEDKNKKKEKIGKKELWL